MLPADRQKDIDPVAAAWFQLPARAESAEV
jgi:hypothetical protein